MSSYLKLRIKSGLMGVLLMVSVSTFAIHDHEPMTTGLIGNWCMVSMSAATALALLYKGESGALACSLGATAWFGLRMVFDPDRESKNKLLLAGDALGLCAITISWAGFESTAG